MAKRVLTLNQKLIDMAARAGRSADGDNTPDDDENKDTGADDDTTTDDTEEKPAPASKKSKAKGKAKRAADDGDPDDEDKEDDGEGADDSEDDDEDPDKEDDGEGADDSEDDDEDEKLPPASKSKSKASGERARISAITRHSAADGREDLAQYLAFETNLSAGRAVAILKHAPKAKSAVSLRSRMASIENPDVRPGKGAAKDQDIVASTAALAEKFGY